MSPELPEGSWWDHRIVGCAIETDAGRALGTVREVIHTAANDVWSAVDDDGVETLVPVLKDVIIDVDEREADRRPRDPGVDGTRLKHRRVLWRTARSR